MTNSQQAGRLAPASLGAWLSLARARLKPLSDQPGLEATVLAAALLGQTRATLLAHPELPLSKAQLRELDGLLERLLQGEPLPYLTSKQEFFGLSFQVGPDVLIPRPETELLVETALAWLRASPAPRLAADVGCGSGCIAVSLAAHTPTLTILACDRSREALRVTQHNAAAHAVHERVHLLQSDLLSSAAGPFDLVCANLPYIPSPSLTGLPVARHEPLLALDGGPDGLRLIRALLQDAPRWLASGGLLLLEIEYRQGQAVSALARQSFPSARVELLHDLAGLDRLVCVHNHHVT